MAKPPKQRQAEYRENLRRSGRVTITTTVTSDAASLLRRLAKEYGRTQGEVIALGLLLARQRLTQPAAPVAQAPAAPALQPRPEAPDAPAVMRKSEARAHALAKAGNAPEHAADALPVDGEHERPAWWPANAAELLGRN